MEVLEFTAGRTSDKTSTWENLPDATLPNSLIQKFNRPPVFCLSLSLTNLQLTKNTNRMKALSEPGLIKLLFYRIFALFCALIFGGCAHFYYLPDNPNVPLFTEKYEFRGSLSAGGGAVSSGTDIQAAMSVTNHLAVMADFMTSKYYSAHKEDKNTIRGNYFDVAAGYFKPFNDHLVFELYGGFGSSSQHHEYYAWPDNIYRGKSDLKYVKTFLQPSIGATFNVFDVAFSSGLSSVNFNKIDYSVDETSMYHEELSQLENNRKHFLIEPAITVRAGWKSFKMQFQYIISTNLTHNDLALFEPYKISFGISVSLSKKYIKNQDN